VLDSAARGIVLMILVKQTVLINAAGRACLSDIGFTNEELGADDAESSANGSRWIAPEVFKNRKFSKQSDVFSFGFVASEVCSPIPPPITVVLTMRRYS